MNTSSIKESKTSNITGGALSMSELSEKRISYLDTSGMNTVRKKNQANSAANLPNVEITVMNENHNMNGQHHGSSGTNLLV
jgi:hypothetical protein